MESTSLARRVTALFRPRKKGAPPDLALEAVDAKLRRAVQGRAVVRGDVGGRRWWSVGATVSYVDIEGAENGEVQANSDVEAYTRGAGFGYTAGGGMRASEEEDGDEEDEDDIRLPSGLGSAATFLNGPPSPFVRGAAAPVSSRLDKGTLGGYARARAMSSPNLGKTRARRNAVRRRGSATTVMPMPAARKDESEASKKEVAEENRNNMTNINNKGDIYKGTADMYSPSTRTSTSTGYSTTTLALTLAFPFPPTTTPSPPPPPPIPPPIPARAAARALAYTTTDILPVLPMPSTRASTGIPTPPPAALSILALLPEILTYVPTATLPALIPVSRAFASAVRGALYDTLVLDDLPASRAEALLALLVSRATVRARVHAVVWRRWGTWWRGAGWDAEEGEIRGREGEAVEKVPDARAVLLSATLALVLARMPRLAALTLPDYDAALLPPSYARAIGVDADAPLRALTIYSTHLSPAALRSLLVWLARPEHAAISALRLPRLALDDAALGADAGAPSNSDGMGLNSPALLPRLTTLHAPPALALALAAPFPATASKHAALETRALALAAPFPASSPSTARADVEITETRRPITSLTMHITTTLYTGLRPAALMADLCYALGIPPLESASVEAGALAWANEDRRGDANGNERENGAENAVRNEFGSLDGSPNGIVNGKEDADGSVGGTVGRNGNWKGEENGNKKEKEDEGPPAPRAVPAPLIKLGLVFARSVDRRTVEKVVGAVGSAMGGGGIDVAAQDVEGNGSAGLHAHKDAHENGNAILGENANGEEKGYEGATTRLMPTPMPTAVPPPLTTLVQEGATMSTGAHAHAHAIAEYRDELESANQLVNEKAKNERMDEQEQRREDGSRASAASSSSSLSSSGAVNAATGTSVTSTSTLKSTTNAVNTTTNVHSTTPFVGTSIKAARRARKESTRAARRAELELEPLPLPLIPSVVPSTKAPTRAPPPVPTPISPPHTSPRSILNEAPLPPIPPTSPPRLKIKRKPAPRVPAMVPRAPIVRDDYEDDDEEDFSIPGLGAGSVRTAASPRENGWGRVSGLGLGGGGYAENRRENRNVWKERKSGYANGNGNESASGYAGDGNANGYAQNGYAPPSGSTNGYALNVMRALQQKDLGYAQPTPAGVSANEYAHSNLHVNGNVNGYGYAFTHPHARAHALRLVAGGGVGAPAPQSQSQPQSPAKKIPRLKPRDAIVGRDVYTSSSSSEPESELAPPPRSPPTYTGLNPAFTLGTRPPHSPPALAPEPAPRPPRTSSLAGSIAGSAGGRAGVDIVRPPRSVMVARDAVVGRGEEDEEGEGDEDGWEREGKITPQMESAEAGAENDNKNEPPATQWGGLRALEVGLCADADADEGREEVCLLLFYFVSQLKLIPFGRRCTKHSVRPSHGTRSSRSSGSSTPTRRRKHKHKRRRRKSTHCLTHGAGCVLRYARCCCSPGRGGRGPGAAFEL